MSHRDWRICRSSTDKSPIKQRVVNGIRHDLDTLNRSIGRHESELQVLERQLTE